ELRVGVSRTLAVRALAQHAGLETRVVEHRLMGTWEPSTRAFEALVASEDGAGADLSRPYPFFLASPLAEDPSSLGPIAEWPAEADYQHPRRGARRVHGLRSPGGGRRRSARSALVGATRAPRSPRHRPRGAPHPFTRGGSDEMGGAGRAAALGAGTRRGGAH